MRAQLRVELAGNALLLVVLVLVDPLLTLVASHQFTCHAL
jgi:hypothetical protein